MQNFILSTAANVITNNFAKSGSYAITIVLRVHFSEIMISKKHNALKLNAALKAFSKFSQNLILFFALVILNEKSSSDQTH